MADLHSFHIRHYLPAQRMEISTFSETLSRDPCNASNSSKIGCTRYTVYGSVSMKTDNYRTQADRATATPLDRGRGRNNPASGCNLHLCAPLNRPRSSLPPSFPPPPPKLPQYIIARKPRAISQIRVSNKLPCRALFMPRERFTSIEKKKNQSSSARISLTQP